MKDNWWNKKAEEIKKCGERNNSQGLYSALKTVYDPKTNTAIYRHERNIKPMERAFSLTAESRRQGRP